MKRIFRQLLSFIFILIVLVTSSCSKSDSDGVNASDDDIVFEYGDKKITKAIYQSYYEKNKEYITSLYKEYYDSIPDQFYNYFGFMPDGTEEYWETEFWNVTLKEYKMTAGEFLDQSTIKACKEYLVYEQIASDYNYNSLPESVTSQIDSFKQQNISTYGSFEAWDTATILQYGYTADELIDLSYVSAYGTVLPDYIFKDQIQDMNNVSFTDNEVIESLSEYVQFKYSVFKYNTEIESSDTKEYTEEERKKYYNDLMLSYYNSVTSGEKEFNDIYKLSHEYDDCEDSAPNGVLEEKVYFNEYFSSDLSEFKAGEIHLFQTDKGVFLIQIVDYSSDIIKYQKENLIKLKKSEIQNKIDEDFSSLVETYFDKIRVNKNLLSVLTKHTDD